MDSSLKKGDHTWDLAISYCRCPKCGFIFENRERFTYRLGNYIKDLECQRCKHFFTIRKKVKPRIGPIFGENQTIEMEWGDR